MLEKGESVTTRDKGRGEIRGEAGEITRMVANAHTTNGQAKGIEHLVDGGGQLEKWRYCWWLVGLMWTEVQNLICQQICQYQGR